MGENTCKVYVRYVFVALVAMQTFQIMEYVSPL